MIPHHQFKSFFNLTWNPFLQEKPTTALFEEEQVSQFCWNVEQLVFDGGFALCHGDPGFGKSAAMRILEARLKQIPELNVRKIERPQSRVRDFYREMASLFGVEIQTSNRFGSFQKIREQWLSIIHSNLFRPILIVDEAQEMPDEVLSELRMISSADLDARSILGVIFAGDSRLITKLKSPNALPLYSRIRAQLPLGARSPEVMRNILQTSMKAAGNADLMTQGVIRALSEQSLGNPRAMMNCANLLLNEALLRESKQIDENTYFAVTRSQPKKKT
jgi:type II secretory pathway predicted ATPase ExeA